MAQTTVLTTKAKTKAVARKRKWRVQLDTKSSKLLSDIWTLFPKNEQEGKQREQP
jgi:hypothetical protein